MNIVVCQDQLEICPSEERDKLRNFLLGTGSGGCVSIQWSVGIDRSPWYYLAGGKDGLRKDSELRKCKGAVLVA